MSCCDVLKLRDRMDWSLLAFRFQFGQTDTRRNGKSKAQTVVLPVSTIVVNHVVITEDTINVIIRKMTV